MEINTVSAVTRTSKVRVVKAAEPKPGKSTPKPSVVKSAGKSVAKPAAKASPAKKAATKSAPKSVPESTSRTTPRTETLSIPAKRKAVSSKPAVAAPMDLAPLIATAAYFMAEHRNFVPGQELQDWFAAEQMIRAARAS